MNKHEWTPTHENVETRMNVSVLLWPESLIPAQKREGLENGINDAAYSSPIVDLSDVAPG